MKAVITGANSFIGQSLSRRLLEAGWEVVQVSRHPAKDGSGGGKSICLPMDEYSSLGALAGPCDCLIHLAWAATRGAGRMDKQSQELNVRYSLDGLRSVLDAGCRRVITAGSQAEYGRQEGIITEESECRPNTEYGRAKLEFFNEAADLCISCGASLKEPRFFSLYGPHDHPDTMVMSILSNMLANRPCRLTECAQMWDFLYIEDATRALSLLCSCDCADGAYNFASGDIRMLRDYVKEMAEVTGTKADLLFGAAPVPQWGIVSLQPDISKLKAELNWRPAVSFAEGIREIIAALPAAF